MSVQKFLISEKYLTSNVWKWSEKGVCEPSVHKDTDCGLNKMEMLLSQSSNPTGDCCLLVRSNCMVCNLKLSCPERRWLAYIRKYLQWSNVNIFCRKLLDPGVALCAKPSMFLNLVYKSLKADTLLRRVKAFVKRLLQVTCGQMPPFACGVLYLVSELLKIKPGLWVQLQDHVVWYVPVACFFLSLPYLLTSIF